MAIAFRYGLLAPSDGADLARSILEAGHALRERLVAVEIERRRAVRLAYRLDPASDAAGAEALGASKAAKAALAALRASKARRRLDKGAGEDPELEPLKAALSAAREAEYAACAAWAKARRAAGETPVVREAIGAANRAAKEASSDASEQSALHWGTREVVVAACAKAFGKRPLYDYAYPNDPEPRPFDGHGRIALRLTSNGEGGVPVPAVFLPPSKTSRVVIERAPAPAPARHGPRRIGKRADEYRVLRLRIGDAWVSWPCKLARPLPAHGRVLGVTVCATRNARRIDWHAVVSVETGLPEPSSASGEVAVVDLGWRQEDDGALHVATVWDPARRAAERVVLSARVATGADRRKGEARAGVIASLLFADGLRKDSDRLFDRQVAALAQWVDSLGERAPAWLREGVSSAHAWRAHGRLVELVMAWQERRFEADAEDVEPLRAWMDERDRQHYDTPADAFSAMRAWVNKDQHLWIWERNERASAQRERKDIYRRVAHGLARDYRVVVFANTNLAREARLRKSVDEKRSNPTARHNRALASVGELRLAIEQAMVKAGGRVDRVMVERKALASANDEGRCAAIHGVWSDPARKGEIKSKIAEKKESMWARLRRQKAERLAAEQAAREPACNAAEG